MSNIERLLALVSVVVWFWVGILIGREIERSMHADRPPDSLFSCPEIPEINRVTWRDGERRA